MEQLDTISFLIALRAPDFHPPFTIPHDCEEWDIGAERLPKPVTREFWNGFDWNPGLAALAARELRDGRTSGRGVTEDEFNLWTSKDSRNPTKPSWDSIVESYRLSKAKESVWYVASEAVGRRASAVALKAVDHAVSSSAVEVAGGINHMAAMIHHRNEAEIAGQLWPAAIMRDSMGGEVVFLTGNEASELIGATARNRNRASSASNIVQGKLATLERLAHDPSGGLSGSATISEKRAARIAAGEEWHRIIEDMDTVYASALARVDRLRGGELPTNLSLYRAKNVLITRLEAAAMSKIKAGKDALSQQGVDTRAACSEMEEAEMKISEELMKGRILIQRVQDTIWKKTGGVWATTVDPMDLKETPDHEGDDPPAGDLGDDGDLYLQTGSGLVAAQAVYSATVENIEKVKTLNTPVWLQLNPAGTETDFASFETQLVTDPRDNKKKIESYSVRAEVLQIRADHPADEEVTGKVSIKVVSPNGSGTFVIPPGDEDYAEATLFRSSPISQFILTATSICGTSELLVLLAP